MKVHIELQVSKKEKKVFDVVFKSADEDFLPQVYQALADELQDESRIVLMLEKKEISFDELKNRWDSQKELVLEAKILTSKEERKEQEQEESDDWLIIPDNTNSTSKESASTRSRIARILLSCLCCRKSYKKLSEEKTQASLKVAEEDDSKEENGMNME